MKQCWLVWGFVLSFSCSCWIYLLSFTTHIIVLWDSGLRPFILLVTGNLKGLMVSIVLPDHSFKNNKSLYNWRMYNCLLGRQAIVKLLSLLFYQTQHNTRKKQTAFNHDLKQLWQFKVYHQVMLTMQDYESGMSLSHCCTDTSLCGFRLFPQQEYRSSIFYEEL